MDWFKVSVIFVSLLMVGVYVYIFVTVQDKSVADSPRVYYGSEKPIYINGNFVAVYEPITSELRQPTLKDKLYYGELK